MTIGIQSAGALLQLSSAIMEGEVAVGVTVRLPGVVADVGEIVGCGGAGVAVKPI